MTLVIPPGFASAAFVMTATEGTPPFVSTCGLDISSAGGDFVAAANSAFDAWALAVMPVIDTDVTLDRVTLSIGQDGPGGSVDSTEVAVQGGRSGDTAAFAMAAIIRKVTNTIGRRGRGRIFLPACLSDAEVDQAGTVLAARATILRNAMLAFDQRLRGDLGTGLVMPPVLLHSQEPADPTPIVDWAVSDLVGWVRGRIR